MKTINISLMKITILMITKTTTITKTIKIIKVIIIMTATKKDDKNTGLFI